MTLEAKCKKQELAPLILWGGEYQQNPKAFSFFVFFFWNGDFKQV